MQHQQDYQPSFFEYTKIVSIVYAIILVSFGIIFPIAEALNDQWLKTIYNTVFLVSNLTLASIFLVYLLFYNLRVANKKKSKQNKIRTLNKLQRFLTNTKKLFCNNSSSNNSIVESLSPIQSKRSKSLSSNMADTSINERPFEMMTIKSTREYSICSTTSSVGIDLGVLRRDSVTPDDISHDRDIYIATREIKPVDEIQDIAGRKTTKATTIIEDDLENSSLVEDKRQHLIDEAYEFGVNKSTEDGEAVTYIDVESFGSVFTHHGSSMFLRLGALIFGLGNLVYYALEIQANLLYNVKCSNSVSFGWIFIWKFAFVLLQTFFLFKHAMIHVTKHKPLVWFGMVHLIFTNVTLWIHTLVREIAEEYHYDTLSETYHSNFSEFTEALHSKCDSDLLHSATKYLLPFVLEYSLIAVGSISCFLYFGGIDRNSDPYKGHRHLVRVFSLAPSEFDKYNQVNQSPLVTARKRGSKVHFNDKVSKRDNEINNNNNSSSNNNNNNNVNNKAEVIPVNHPHTNRHMNPLQKSHMGLFGGIVVLCLTTVACVVFLFSNMQGQPSRGEVVFYSADIFIHSSLLIACIAVFVLTRSLAFAPKPVSTDDILLLIAAFGSLTYEAVNVAALFSSTGVLEEHGHTKNNLPSLPHNSTLKLLNSTKHFAKHEDYDYNTLSNLQLTSAMIGLIETAVQALLILVSLRRYPASVKDAKNMPGRGTLAFLIVGNLSVWILRTVLCKNIHTPIQTSFYGNISWHLLMNINLPLLLFFRFHSSACFADIWKVAYELLTRPEKPHVQHE